MNWTRLLQVIEWANARSGNREYTARKPDRGWNWTCYPAPLWFLAGVWVGFLIWAVVEWFG